MAEKTIWRKCNWCELALEGPDADEPRGWLHIETDDEDDLDFCSLECAIAYLPD